MEDSKFTLAKTTKTHIYFTQLKVDLFLKNNKPNQATCGTHWNTDAEVQNSLSAYISKSERMEIQSPLLQSNYTVTYCPFHRRQNLSCYIKPQLSWSFNFRTGGVWNSSAAAVHLSTTVDAAELQPLWGAREATSHHTVQNNILHLSPCNPNPPHLFPRQQTLIAGSLPDTHLTHTLL